MLTENQFCAFQSFCVELENEELKRFQRLWLSLCVEIKSSNSSFTIYFLISCRLQILCCELFIFKTLRGTLSVKCAANVRDFQKTRKNSNICNALVRVLKYYHVFYSFLCHLENIISIGCVCMCVRELTVSSVCWKSTKRFFFISKYVLL